MSRRDLIIMLIAALLAAQKQTKPKPPPPPQPGPGTNTIS